MYATPTLPSDHSFIRHWSTLTLVICFLSLSACDLKKKDVKCHDFFKPGDRGGFEYPSKGIALFKENGTQWYRCAAGQKYLHNKCKGESLKVTWDDAVSYAQEFSEKTGSTWRLPSKSEMKSIMESQCHAPTLNTNVFPSAEVSNYWTASRGFHQDQFKCAVFTYNGNLSCRQTRKASLPFLLVKD